MIPKISNGTVWHPKVQMIPHSTQNSKWYLVIPKITSGTPCMVRKCPSGTQQSKWYPMVHKCLSGRLWYPTVQVVSKSTNGNGTQKYKWYPKVQAVKPSDTPWYQKFQVEPCGNQKSKFHHVVPTNQSSTLSVVPKKASRTPWYPTVHSYPVVLKSPSGNPWYPQVQVVPHGTQKSKWYATVVVPHGTQKSKHANGCGTPWYRTVQVVPCDTQKY